MNLYAATLQAALPERTNTQVFAAAVVFLAEDEYEAQSIGRRSCLERFSTDEGYTRHNVHLLLVPQRARLLHAATERAYFIDLVEI